jgi:hypothetical protein
MFSGSMSTALVAPAKMHRRAGLTWLVKKSIVLCLGSRTPTAPTRLLSGDFL